MTGRAVLLLILAATPAVADDPVGLRIDKDRFIFKQIEDKQPIRPDEAAAYTAVLLHARQFPADELEAGARRDVTFRDLFFDPDGHRLELVYFDGRLKQLRRTEPTADLADAGVTDLYEGWLFPRDEKNPVVVLLTALPEGLSPQRDLKQDLNVRVGFAGYSFKLFRYESRKPDPKDTSRNVERYAPLLMGHSVTVVPDAGPQMAAAWEGTFLPVVLGGVTLVGVVLVGFAWWFRRGDRAYRETAEQRRQVNPFD